MYLLHILLGSTIYDPALSLMSLDIVQYTVVRLTSAFPVHNLEEQIRSVKSCDNRDRRFKSKILDDIPPYYICCCSGKRKLAVISCLTRSVAVAVNALTTGRSGSFARKSAISR